MSDRPYPSRPVMQSALDRMAHDLARLSKDLPGALTARARWDVKPHLFCACSHSEHLHRHDLKVQVCSVDDCTCRGLQHETAEWRFTITTTTSLQAQP